MRTSTILNVSKLLRTFNLALILIAMIMLIGTNALLHSLTLMLIAVVLLLISTLLDNYVEKYGRDFEFVSYDMRKNNSLDELSQSMLKPRRADKGSCGYDFYSPYTFTVKPNEQKMIWTDIKVYMLPNEALFLDVRSSQGKVRIRLANTIGLIDSTYYNNEDNEGNIGILIENNGDKDYTVKAGDKFCQGMFLKYLTVGHDKPVNQKRLGGWGSSGK